METPSTYQKIKGCSQDLLWMLVQPDSQTKELPIYESLTPMRCVLAKKFSPQNWEVIKLMEQHKEERKKDPFYLGKPIYSKDVLYILTREWVLHSTHQGSQNYCKAQCASRIAELLWKVKSKTYIFIGLNQRKMNFIFCLFLNDRTHFFPFVTPRIGITSAH